MPLYREKMPPVEARELTLHNWRSIAEWLGYAWIAWGTGGTMLIENRSGRVNANLGDWIVHLEDGFYPMSPAEFHAEYERADAQ